MAADLGNRRISVEEYIHLVQSAQDGKYEYEDGQMRAQAGGTSNHADISGNMYIALREQLGHTTPCRAYVADKVVQVAERRFYIPDVVVSCDIADHGKAVIIRSPRLIVEVLSPSTQLLDRSKKLAGYQSCPSVQEVMLISQEVQFVEMFRRSSETEQWLYYQYHANEIVILESLDIKVLVSALYQGLAIPVDEEDEPV